MQKHVNLVDLVKSFPTNIFLQNLASIQKRTSPVKFAHLAEKSGKGSISNLSTKVSARALHVRGPRGPEENTSAQAPPAATPQLPPSETQPAAAGGVESDDWGPCWSRRAAAGRAELLAKKGHTGRVQNPAKVSENRPACGTAQHTLAVCFVFEKLEKSRKFLVKIWRKFSKILAKFGFFSREKI